MRKKLLQILLIVLACFIMFKIGVSVGYKKYIKEYHEQEIQKQSDTVQNSESKKEQQTEENETALTDLKSMIENEINNKLGTWAVYVEDLKNGNKLQINNHKMVSASLIKLFIMGEVYNEVLSDDIDKKAVDNYLERMITISDNHSSNVLVARLGGGEYSDMYSQTFQDGLKKVNQFAKSIDCLDTEQQRDMMDSRPKPITEQNYTSVVDCGNILSKIYHKQLISDDYDTEMLELLKKQTRRSKIPAGIPSDIKCANKTGELSDVENDVAIVFSPSCDYIICVMSNDVPDTTEARNTITKISSIVYNYFNSNSN